MSVRIEINGVGMQVAPGTTVLEAARALGEDIPTLCLDERLDAFRACRVCLVAVDGVFGPVAACTTPCRDGMKVDATAATARRVAAAICHGDLVSVRSAHGSIELPARVTDRIEPGHVFTAFHFLEIRTNLLVGASADVNTSCPEYKVVAVDVRPVAEQASRTPAIAAAT